MGLAPIERLPIELLQPIFIGSDYNVALLKASPYIAARLSSDYIYESTCNYYLTDVRGPHSEQSAAQTCILASRWMTWTFLKAWIVRRYGPDGCLCGLTQDEGCFDPQWPPSFEDATNMIFSRSHLPKLAFVKGRIPIKLLRGPWTKQKVEFLRFILWITSMTVDWSDHDVRKTAIEGRTQAILDGNLEAVELFNNNRRLGHATNLINVLFAVIEADCDRSIVFDTLRAATKWRTCNSTDQLHQLDGWCEARVAEGNPKGHWLRMKLNEVRAINNRHKAGELHAETGDYDGGPEDRLIVRDLEWIKTYRSYGWFCRQSHASAWAGIHNVREEDLHEYRSHLYGQHHICRGRNCCKVTNRWNTFRVGMWIPATKHQEVDPK